jgi:hypothetical protein
MDAPTVSAFAAAGAAIIAATVAGIQFFIGRKQAEAALVSAKAAEKTAKSAGRHRITEFRQAWSNTIIEVLSEYIATVMMLPEDQMKQPGNMKKIGILGTKLGLLLNPDEADSKILLELTGSIFSNTNELERHEKADALMKIAQKILKAEWVRIERELK